MNDDKSSMMDEITGIGDKNKLLEIFKDNDDFEIRYTIVNLIDDDSILYEIFSNEQDSFIKSIALMRISPDILDFDDFNNLDAYEKITYIETYSNESLFYNIAENDENLFVRIAAIDKISDRDFLLKMADNHSDYDTRVVLYKKLNNKPILEEITHENLVESRIDLVKDLNNEKFLTDIAFNDSDVKVRLRALKMLNRPDFYFNLLKDTLSDDDLRRYIKALAENRFSIDVDDFDDFNNFDVYEKISYIETHSSESLFFKVAENDEDFRVRIAAIDKISDRDFLLKMADNHSDYGTRIVLYKKIYDKSILEEITCENLKKSRIDLVKDLDNEKFLTDIAFNDSDMEVQIQALKKLNRPDFYFTLLKNTSDPDDIRRVIKGIKDESQLMDIATFFSSDSFIVENAVNNISNPSLLFELYQRDSYIFREAVMKKLVFGNVFSREKITDKISIKRKVLSICSEDALGDIIRNDSFENLHRFAVEMIGDEAVLADVARNNSDSGVRRIAVDMIGDEAVLADVARNDFVSNIRRIAVDMIGDEAVLADVARNDSEGSVRRAAVGRIGDEAVLADILMNGINSDVREAAVKKIGYDVLSDILSNSSFDGEISCEAADDALAGIVRNNADWKTCFKAIQCIDNQDILLDIARNNSRNDVQSFALEKIGDDVLADIARNDSDLDFCHKAVHFINDKDILVDIAQNNPRYSFRIIAVEKIDDEDVLVDIARNDSDEDVRRAAVEKISDEDVLVDILRRDCDRNVRKAALKNIKNPNTLYDLILENYGYFSLHSYSAFKRNYDELIYESIGTDIYEDIFDKLSDESVLIDLLHEKLFGDFRVLTVRRLVSADVLRNLALNDLDYRVRREAVKNPNLCDSKTFAEIVQSDYNDSVRLEALKQIDDEEILEAMINDLSPLIKLYAFERLGKYFSSNKCDVSFDDIDLDSIQTIDDENILCAIVKNVPSSAICKYAFDKIRDERILADIVFYSEEFMNRALNKITDNALLLNIALYSTDSTAKRKAIKKIEDEEFLLDAVQNNPYNEISEYIVGRIRDESLLEIIAFNNSNPYNRKAAVNKIQSQDILTRLCEVESEEVVCAAIVRKTHDKSLLEYVGLSNPCKTVRRYVGSITDDDELLYRFALKEYESDNRRELISRLTNEEYVYKLFKRECYRRVFDADFQITNLDMLIDLAKNSVSHQARDYALKHINDESILLDFVYSSPFSSYEPKDKSLWEGFKYYSNDIELCLSIIADLDFDDLEVIEDLLINNVNIECNMIFAFRNRITEISSIYKIALNCKSNNLRRVFKSKLKYYVNYRDEQGDDEITEEEAALGLGALFG